MGEHSGSKYGFEPKTAPKAAQPTVQKPVNSAQAELRRQQEAALQQAISTVPALTSDVTADYNQHAQHLDQAPRLGVRVNGDSTAVEINFEGDAAGAGDIAGAVARTLSAAYGVKVELHDRDEERRAQESRERADNTQDGYLRSGLSSSGDSR